MIGKHSTKGLGRLAPDPSGDVPFEDGVLISLGTEKPTGVSECELDHNEFIVYDVGQVRMRYLLKIQFVPK
jgi:poly [ADP-ribose] polymerase